MTKDFEEEVLKLRNRIRDARLLSNLEKCGAYFMILHELVALLDSADTLSRQVVLQGFVKSYTSAKVFVPPKNLVGECYQDTLTKIYYLLEKFMPHTDQSTAEYVFKDVWGLMRFYLEDERDASVVMTVVDGFDGYDPGYDPYVSNSCGRTMIGGFALKKF